MFSVAAASVLPMDAVARTLGARARGRVDGAPRAGAGASTQGAQARRSCRGARGVERRARAGAGVTRIPRDVPPGDGPRARPMATRARSGDALPPRPQCVAPATDAGARGNAGCARVIVTGARGMFRGARGVENDGARTGVVGRGMACRGNVAGRLAADLEDNAGGAAGWPPLGVTLGAEIRRGPEARADVRTRASRLQPSAAPLQMPERCTSAPRAPRAGGLPRLVLAHAADALPMSAKYRLLMKSGHTDLRTGPGLSRLAATEAGLSRENSVSCALQTTPLCRGVQATRAEFGGCLRVFRLVLFRRGEGITHRAETIRVARCHTRGS